MMQISWRLSWCFLMLMPYPYKFIAKSFRLIDGFRILVCRFRKIYSLAYSQTSLIQTHSAIQMSVFYYMIGAWYPVLVICHFLRIHLEPTICSVFLFVLPRDFSYQIIIFLPSYFAPGLLSEWNSAQASFLCLIKFLQQYFQPMPKVLPFDLDLGVSSTIFISQRSGPGFYLALRKIISEIGFLVPLPKVQLLDVSEVGIQGFKMSLQYVQLSLKRLSLEKLYRCAACLQVVAD